MDITALPIEENYLGKGFEEEGQDDVYDDEEWLNCQYQESVEDKDMFVEEEAEEIDDEEDIDDEDVDETDEGDFTEEDEADEKW